MSPLDLLVAAPLGFMLAALALGGQGRWLILLASPLMMGLAIWLAVLPPEAAHVVGGWDLPLGILLRGDGVARLFVLGAALCAALVGLHALHEFSPRGGGLSARNRGFWPLFYLLWAGANAGFLTTDLFNLYVALEMVSLAGVGLSALGSLQAALRYFLIALMGSLAYLLGVALLFANYGTVDVTLLARTAEADAATVLALAVMTGGLLVKSALFPLHGWLPPAHAAAPAPASALLSAIVVKLGFVILMRLWFEAFATLAAPVAVGLLGALGAAGVIYGSVQAMRQRQLKALVAYSTVAQVGYLFVAFPLAAAGDPSAAWSGMTLHAVAHMLAKCAMFLAAGLMLKAVHGRDIDDLAGLARVMPATVTAFALAAVSLMGLPPSGGFAAKFMLLDAALAQGAFFYAAVLLGGGLMAAVYLFRAIAVAFSGAHNPAIEVPAPFAAAAPLALALCAIALGFFGVGFADLAAIAAPWAQTDAIGAAP